MVHFRCSLCKDGEELNQVVHTGQKALHLASKYLEISIHLGFCLNSLSNLPFFMIPLETNFFSLVLNDI